jgi:PAS domain S-box-containing protein
MPYTITIAQGIGFSFAPVSLCVTQKRVIVACKQAFELLFGFEAKALIGQSMALLYPSLQEFRRTGQRGYPHMHAGRAYSDERIMRRADGRLFWCHVQRDHLPHLCWPRRIRRSHHRCRNYRRSGSFNAKLAISILPTVCRAASPWVKTSAGISTRPGSVGSPVNASKMTFVSTKTRALAMAVRAHPAEQHVGVQIVRDKYLDMLRDLGRKMG